MLKKLSRDFRNVPAWKLADRKYSFTKVEIPKKLAAEVVLWGQQYVPERLIYPYVTPWGQVHGRENNPHITVKWGIVHDDVEPIKALVTKCPPIVAVLGKVSCFDGDEYDVLKIDVESEDLIRLHNSICDNVENIETFEYSPHMTIAYVEPGYGHRLSGSKHFDGINLTFSRVIFVHQDKTEIPIPLDGNSVSGKLPGIISELESHVNLR